MESILTSIKKLLNIDEEDTDFDVDIIIGINSALSTLTQLGVGPEEGFSISDKSTTWTDYLGGFKKLEFVKSYVHLKTKLVFDPPSSASILQMIKEEIKELEWRINTSVDTGEEDTTNG